MKKLLIIVPAFNEEKTIGSTLNGLLSIKDEIIKIGYELIIHVINDGSTDDTKNIAEKFEKV